MADPLQKRTKPRAGMCSSACGLALSFQQLVQRLDAFLLQERSEFRVPSVAFCKRVAILCAEGSNQRVATLGTNRPVLVTLGTVQPFRKVLRCHLHHLSSSRAF